MNTIVGFMFLFEGLFCPTLRKWSGDGEGCLYMGDLIAGV